jgi:hypothetical protein
MFDVGHYFAASGSVMRVEWGRNKEKVKVMRVRKIEEKVDSREERLKRSVIKARKNIEKEKYVEKKDKRGTVRLCV